MNLVSNAAKVTETGFVEVNLTRVGADDLAIAVSDTGPGVSKEQVSIIFQK